MLNNFWMVFLLYTTTLCQSNKCKPNQHMKYELNDTSELKGYHSLCRQFSKRTCCSGRNFDVLAKKISSKLISSSISQNNDDSLSLSPICRRRLTSILCSVCDGDIGEQSLTGICQQVCNNVYQSCKYDYFSIDSLGNMKVCKDEDIVCSKLQDILGANRHQEKYQVCQYFGIKVEENKCWDGVPSYVSKGIPKKKVEYKAQNNSNVKKSKLSWIHKLIRNIQIKHLLYLITVFFLLFIAIYKYFSMKYANYKRQIRNQ